ncbi:MAG: MBL fold metallo-hydrolase [Gemmataceae bacterium]|nr:MBL fold metallo-hydrolase [Gemmataceae bacterium]
MPAKLQVQTVVSLPFEENSYVVWQQGQGECLVFDPGLEPDLILQFLQDKELRPAAILNTHGHADHIGGNQALKQCFPSAPLVIGAGDAALLTDANLNLSAPFGMPVVSPCADRTVREGEMLELGGVHLEVIEIPGHSLGHVVYLYRDQPCLVFGGDVLFRGSVGRTDFPGGSFEALAQGIHAKLFSLPDDTVIYPGHGPVTTVGHEKRTNPFVGQAKD